MLFFALLLQTVSTDSDPTGEPPLPRILDLAAQNCEGVVCDPGRRYRLDVDSTAGEDAKNRALRGVWQPCGTTGAPVCPSKPRALVRFD